MSAKFTTFLHQMKTPALLILTAAGILLFTGCQPSQTAIQTTIDAAVVSTQAKVPTATALPTYTPYFTATPYATQTDLPTYTPLPTGTPRPTYTALPTSTRRPTYTPLPTSTPLPTYTPLATSTPRPTYTALPTLTDYPTDTPMPTATARPTYTPAATQTKLPTHTPEPTFTPQPTFTMPPTYTPVIRIIEVTATYDSDITKAPKQDGFYLIGPEIADGVWRTEAAKTKCYWKITDIKGGILTNYIGPGGGTIPIDKNAFQFEVRNCGQLVYIRELVYPTPTN